MAILRGSGEGAQNLNRVSIDTVNIHQKQMQKHILFDNDNILGIFLRPTLTAIQRQMCCPSI